MVNRALGGPIESKLQVIELSLLPPNSQGFIPAGIHRFPFEFPIPPTLPPTINIANRLAIYYRLTATLRKSSEGTSFMDWARRSMGKKKLVDVSYLRLVRAIEATPAHALPPSPSTSTASSTISAGSDSHTVDVNRAGPTVEPLTDLWSQYNNRLSLDEQHDRLVHSMGGRTTDNFSRPMDTLTKEHGVRYRLSVDRTAIALGTSVGLEVVLQPTQVRTKVRSIYLMIEEKQTFKMKIPGHHSLSNAPAETRKHTETQKMMLKWAYGYPIPPEEELAMGYGDQRETQQEGCQVSPLVDVKENVTQLGKLYSHDVRHCKSLQQLDQSYSGRQQPQQSSTLLGKTDFATSSISALSAMKPSNIVPNASDFPSSSSSSSSSPKDKLLNLKLLDHPIELCEYFEGRFVLPVPPCNDILHASMNHNSINIRHWLRMVVVLEQDGRLFELALESPMQMLDCRLVADDERQTILPPPPSYDRDDRSIPSNVFWEQRQPITTCAQWGTCQRPCPCQIRQKAQESNSTTKLSPPPGNSILQQQQHQQQPEWGPPPLYFD